MRTRTATRSLLRRVAPLASGGALLLVPLVGANAANASPVPGTVYASAPSSRPCGAPDYSTISAAVAAAPSGGRVVVCPGTYSEDVVVDEPLTIQGFGATVDPGTAENSPYYAALGNNAFTVEAAGVTIEGLTVEGAGGDGILSVANDTTVRDDTAIGNGTVNSAGTGIDLNGSSWSTVEDNTVKDNTGGGIVLTDDLGQPASYDTVLGNDSEDNPDGCGVILADHSGAGVFDNKVIGNQADGNGNDPPGSGAGVILASPVPDGAVYDNTIAANTLEGNGLGGVTLHAHYDGQNFAGNVITANNIGTNNLGGSAAAVFANDYGDADTTGIYLGAPSALSITVEGNLVHNDQYGIFVAGPVTVNGANLNLFLVVPTPYASIPVYPPL
jgi:parallel beta-helix repeat protein